MKSGLSLYKQASESSTDEQFIVDRIELVRRIAWHMKSRLPDSVAIEDLVQAGMIGLIEAANTFDDTKGAAFETWAGIRIRGAILDEVRRNDWVPRSVYQRARKIKQAMNELRVDNGQPSTDQAIADYLEISLEEYRGWLRDLAGIQMLAFDSLEPDSIAATADDSNSTLVDSGGLRAQLKKAIDGLPEREKLLMSLYYEYELTFKEVGEVLGVSESRVSQLHNQAVLRLKDEFN